MDQVVLLMLIMDRKTKKKRKGIKSIKTMQRVLRKRVSRIRVWIGSQKIVGMKVLGKMMIVRVRLCRIWRLIRLIMFLQIWKIKMFSNNKSKWINLMQKDKWWLTLRNQLLHRIWFRFNCKMMSHNSQTLKYQMVRMIMMKKKKAMMINQK